MVASVIYIIYIYIYGFCTFSLSRCTTCDVTCRLKRAFNHVTLLCNLALPLFWLSFHSLSLTDLKALKIIYWSFIYTFIYIYIYFFDLMNLVSYICPHSMPIHIYIHVHDLLIRFLHIYQPHNLVILEY